MSNPTKQKCGSNFKVDGETFVCSLTAGHSGGHGRIDILNTIRRPVMNPPVDETEAGNRANTAPRQADPDAPCRGETGVSSGSEARPVTATELLSSNQRPYCTYEGCKEACVDADNKRLRAALEWIRWRSATHVEAITKARDTLKGSAPETKPKL